MNAAFAQQPTLWQNSGATKIKPSPSKIITTDKQIESTLAIGTSPFAVTSTTKVSNLNSDLLDDQSGSYYLDLSNMLAGTLAVDRGGTGQSSYTNGQLLIGNTTGNTLTKSTLTGTANQVVVTNGNGSITLSTPQDIATSSIPQFAAIGVGGAGTAATAVWMRGTLTGATQRQFYANSTYDATATTAAAMQLVDTADASAINNRFGLRINDLTKANGATLTNNTGIYLPAMTAGGTQNRAIVSETASSATGGYNLYMSGTAPNYMNGALAVGNSGTALGKIESRATSGSQFVAAYDASNTGTWTVGSTGVNTLDATGSGASFVFSDGVSSSGAIVSTGSGGVGYSTGSGGTVTQLTSRTTGVTINKTTGAITLVSAAGSTTWQKFTITNSTVAATDVIVVNQKSGTDSYMTHVTRVAAGAFDVIFATTGGTTTEQPVFNFAVIKGASS